MPGFPRLPKRIAAPLAAGLALGLGTVYAAYRRDLSRIARALSAGSQVVPTPHGPVEFSVSGNGPAVLVVHGAAGGYDQGIAIGRAFGGEGFRWIAPSRFGYLRTPLPADGSTIAQADAFAGLLDHLNIARAPIVAMSGGVPPALQFALRYPRRTSALVLLSSAPYTPLTAAQQQLPVPIWMYNAIFSSDFPYWILTRVARTRLEALFDVTPVGRRSVTAAGRSLTVEEGGFLDRMVDMFQPVTRRSAGLRNEGAAINPRVRYPLEQIAAPTLVIHARDDGINPVAFGEYTARQIPGAEFVPVDSGGHLLLGHHAELQARVKAFLNLHAER